MRFATKVKSLAQDVVTYGASSAVSQAISILLFPVYTRYLGPADYGRLAMLTMAGSLVTCIATAGLPAATLRGFQRQESKHDRQVFISAALFSVGVFSLLVGIAAWPFRELLGSWLVGETSNARWWMTLTLVTACLNAFSGVPRAALRAERKTRLIAGLTVARLILSSTLSITLVAGFEMGIDGLLISNLVGELLATSTLLYFNRKSICSTLDMKWVRWLFGYGLPFIPHRLNAVGLLFLGQFLVRDSLGLAEAGLFNVAIKFAMPAGFVVSAIQQAWVPYKFELHAQDEDPRRTLRSMVTYYFVMLTLLWVGTTFVGMEAIYLLSPATFHTASSLVWVAVLARVSQGIYYMMTTGFEASDDSRPLFLVSLGGLLVVAATGPWLIQSQQAVGAGLATAIGWWTMAIIARRLSYARFPIDLPWMTLFVLVSIGTASIFAIHAWQDYPPPARIALGLVCVLLTAKVGIGWLMRDPAERERWLGTLENVRRRLQKKPS